MDSVWISDHFQPWRHTGGHAPFSLAWLGALGAAHGQDRHGDERPHPDVSLPPLHRRAGLRDARDLVFPGRVVLGLGTGESLNEVPATGMQWPEQKERTARFREALRLIQTLFTEERVSFAGQFYQTKLATIYDRPRAPVPIYVAGAGPFIAKIAGSEADGFICTSGKKWELYTETLLPNVQAGLAASGRPARPFERMIEMKVSFDTDRARALRDTHYWGALALKPEEKVNVEDPLEMERLADALPIERTATRWIVSIDPEEIVEKVGAYVKIGFDHLLFHAPGPDQARFLELFAEQVAPRLRRKFG